MPHGYQSSFLSPSARHPVVLRRQIGVFGAGRSVSRFDQGELQPAVSLPSLPTVAFTGTLMMSWTHRCPRGQMRTARKATHVQTDLGCQVLGNPPVDAWNGVQQLKLLVKRVQPLRYLPVETCNGLVEIVNVAQLFSQHEAMMRSKASRQSLFQLRDLLPQSPLGQFRPLLGIGLPRQQSLQYSSPRNPHHIGGASRQFQVGVFQYFLQPVDNAGSLSHQRGAIAGQIPQIPLRLGRNKAALYQPMLQQFSDPLRI